MDELECDDNVWESIAEHLKTIGARFVFVITTRPDMRSRIKLKKISNVLVMHMDTQKDIEARTTLVYVLCVKRPVTVQVINANAVEPGEADFAPGIKKRATKEEVFTACGSLIEDFDFTYGYTPIAYAARHQDCLGIINILLDRSKTMNVASEHKGTSQTTNVPVVRASAVYEAVAYGHEDILRVLIDHGADVNTQAKTLYGNMTALPTAQTMDRKAIEQLLISHGATWPDS
ncbi:hypothetical protein EX30DRAFT_393959 [Ascodesmis nigricans]|uniref:Uncharacterized protein n=1 Tax=Ascodesmis nigricans TaxID=341454 RepID=A0A4S2N0X4_9PEZI|nr:hypothetical protein EX30DRAFT_393959 [Ascodesmis nigricans]